MKSTTSLEDREIHDRAFVRNEQDAENARESLPATHRFAAKGEFVSKSSGVLHFNIFRAEWEVSKEAAYRNFSAPVAWAYAVLA